MSTLFQPALRNPFGSPVEPSPRQRSMAVLPHNIGNNNISPKSAQEDSIMTSPAPPNMGPPGPGQGNSPDMEQGQTGNNTVNGNREPGFAGANGSTAAGAAGASQGPKVVQTAFIHKLYSMLEDKTIQHLISWSNTNESFVMSPSNEFSKVLAQYFKHTNISSFVRQLNMYGFHKVSDVFHTGSPESALWEFKHGNGSFKKGDLMGLREIKRRASRHTLIHRDSFSNPKPGVSQPGTPAEVMPDTDQRLAGLEQAFYDVHARLQRTEDSYSSLSSRCQVLTEGLVRCHQWTHNLTSAIQNLSSPESPLHRDITELQKEIARQLEYVRALETPQESLQNGRQSFYPGNSALEPPLSPRGYNFDSRRSSIQIEPQHVGLRPPVPPIPPHFSSSPRRFGSISIPHVSPGFSRPALPPQPPPTVHPLASVVTPPPMNLARRHTSADIREHGWPPTNPNESPYASGQSSVHWQPSSPQQPQAAGDQGIRDQLASYEINGPKRLPPTMQASQPTPPLTSTSEAAPVGLGVESSSWALGGSKFPRPNFELHSAPATRRGSMATLHSLLNPAETVEQENEDDGLGHSREDDRKRKRLI
ncbi:Flocculation suppression protein [Cladophialophora chaetospira]|uniref:Flocculation suppression protein n=1 Tax=Cladophialophora chaetospira TaxID=386627 RepID=A0AA38XBC6_9EURO|nr:Flocculation suppression protein [Cladophialophora chaetospira]